MQKKIKTISINIQALRKFPCDSLQRISLQPNGDFPDKNRRFGKTSFPSPLQSVAERLLISFAPLNCCYHIINKLSLCQPIYRTKVHFLKIVQTTHTFSQFIDYQLFTPYILNTITVISLLTTKTRLYRRFFFGGEREVSCCFATNISSAPRDSCQF